MSNSAIIAIAIAVGVVLAAVAFTTTARRSDVRGAGALSGETRQRDDAARRAREQAEAAVSRRDDDVAAEASTALEKASSPAPVPWIPPESPTPEGVSGQDSGNLGVDGQH